MKKEIFFPFQIIMVLLIGLLLAKPGQALEAGDLDLTFGDGGKVIEEDLSGFNDIAIQKDGKIVAVAEVAQSGGFILTRYCSNGLVDDGSCGGAGFGNGGRILTNIGRAVVIQPDGKIVVAGDDTGDDFAVSRYNSDGSLDSTFDDDGLVTTDFGNDFVLIRAMALQSDGKIVVVGLFHDINSGEDDFLMVRYNSNGSFDIQAITDIGVHDNALDVAIDSQGRIVVAGTSQSIGTTNFDFTLVRYNANGILDNTFGGDGKVVEAFTAGATEIVKTIVIQGDGKIIAGGTGNPSGGTVDFALMRFNTNGTLDSQFSSDGKVLTDLNNNNKTDDLFALALQADGKIVAAGRTFGEGADSDFALVRYLPNGSLDNTFGIVTTAFLGQEFANAAMTYLQGTSDFGKIVLAGRTRVINGTNEAILARYLLTNFCGDGIANNRAEQCDDGNGSNNDICLNTCRFNVCGDGFRLLSPAAGAEQCDDGNRVNGDGCEACKVVTSTLCGNGKVNPGEQCDIGTAQNPAPDSCNIFTPCNPKTCKCALCGNALVGPTEECDDGALCDNEEVCDIEVPDVCSDGSACTPVDGDGCSSECKFEDSGVGGDIGGGGCSLTHGTASSLSFLMLGALASGLAIARRVKKVP